MTARWLRVLSRARDAVLAEVAFGLLRLSSAEQRRRVEAAVHTLVPRRRPATGLSQAWMSGEDSKR